MEGKEGSESSSISPTRTTIDNEKICVDNVLPKSIATACDLIIKNYFIPDSAKIHQFHKKIKILRKNRKYRLRQFEDQDDDFESDASFVGPTFNKVHFPKNMKFSSSSGEDPSEDSRDDTEVLSPSSSAYSSSTGSRITSSASDSSYSTGAYVEETSTSTSIYTATTKSSKQEEEEEEEAEDKEEEEVKQEEVIFTSTMVIG